MAEHYGRVVELVEDGQDVYGSTEIHTPDVPITVLRAASREDVTSGIPSSIQYAGLIAVRYELQGGLPEVLSHVQEVYHQPNIDATHIRKDDAQLGEQGMIANGCLRFCTPPLRHRSRRNQQLSLTPELSFFYSEPSGLQTLQVQFHATRYLEKIPTVPEKRLVPPEILGHVVPFVATLDIALSKAGLLKPIDDKTLRAYKNGTLAIDMVSAQDGSQPPEQ